MTGVDPGVGHSLVQGLMACFSPPASVSLPGKRGTTVTPLGDGRNLLESRDFPPHRAASPVLRTVLACSRFAMPMC